MPARAFVPPVPPVIPVAPEQHSGFRMQLPRAVQRAVADAERAARGRRTANRPVPDPQQGGTAAAPIIPHDLGRLFGRLAPAPD